jgi:hypothetical protein
LVLDGGRGGNNYEYGKIDKHKYFLESNVTLEKVNGKLKLKNKCLKLMKENLLNKKLTIEDSKIKKYDYAEKITVIIKLYSKYVLKGYDIEQPSDLKVNLIFNFGYSLKELQSTINNIYTDIVSIIYQYLKLDESIECVSCRQKFVNNNYIIAISCNCNNNTDYCCIKCLKYIVQGYTVDGEMICYQCNESIFFVENKPENVEPNEPENVQKNIQLDSNIDDSINGWNVGENNKASNLLVSSGLTYANVLKAKNK